MGDPLDVLRSFRVDGEPTSTEPWGHGRIHESFAVTVRDGQDARRYLAQRLNERVFVDPEALVENALRVTAHLRARLRARGAPDADRRVLSLVPTVEGRFLHRDAKGRAWRVYDFIERARTVRTARSPAQARDAALAFGTFLRDLDDLPGPRLHETIPGFHDTPARLAALRAAVETDPAGRVRGAGPEIEFALAREATTRLLRDAHEAGEVPERITHNDTKIDNLLLDDATGRPICVVDLDTVMPGLSLHDFGDLVRSCASPSGEDHRKPSRTDARPELLSALVAGWLEAAGDILTAAEIDLLSVAGRVIALELGLRFLTDHLEGDIYFGARRPAHNLDRARAQLALVRALEDREDEVRRMVRTAR